MYYATKRNNTKTRLVGIAGVVFAISGAGYAIANGFGLIENKAPVETEVVIIEELDKVEDEPPPPPPVDVDLPPPPPQVILPDFVFDTPPPENVFKTLETAKTPAPPPPPAAKPAPPPPPTLKEKPKPGRRFKKPDYPSAAARRGESGETTLAVCVDTEGRISNARVVKSSGSETLDDAAVKGLNNNRFDPAVGTDGKVIAMCDPNPYVFTYVWDLKNR